MSNPSTVSASSTTTSSATHTETAPAAAAHGGVHYAEFKLHDPALVPALIRRYPFATITVNGATHPLVAQAPLTVRETAGAQHGAAGAVEFHLARANPVTAHLAEGTPVTVVVSGPSAPISPSWYTARFPGPDADRSRTAPTYDYLSLVLTAAVRPLPVEELHAQVIELVGKHEPAGGWSFTEMDQELFRSWCRGIAGFRLEIGDVDITAKLSQEQAAADLPGICAGLRTRGRPEDRAVADLVEAAAAETGLHGEGSPGLLRHLT